MGRVVLRSRLVPCRLYVGYRGATAKLPHSYRGFYENYVRVMPGNWCFKGCFRSASETAGAGLGGIGWDGVGCGGLSWDKARWDATGLTKKEGLGWGWMDWDALVWNGRLGIR